MRGPLGAIAAKKDKVCYASTLCRTLGWLCQPSRKATPVACGTRVRGKAYKGIRLRQPEDPELQWTPVDTSVQTTHM